MRRAFVCAVIVAMVCAGEAIASVSAGKYSGHYGTHSASKISFTVRGNTVRNFKLDVLAPYYCGWDNQYVFQTFIIPKAKIHSGKVKTTYVIRNSSGQAIGKDKLTATFSGGSAHGTVGGVESGCIFATYKWTAHKVG